MRFGSSHLLALSVIRGHSPVLRFVKVTVGGSISVNLQIKQFKSTIVVILVIYITVV